MKAQKERELLRALEYLTSPPEDCDPDAVQEAVERVMLLFDGLCTGWILMDEEPFWGNENGELYLCLWGERLGVCEEPTPEGYFCRLDAMPAELLVALARSGRLPRFLRYLEGVLRKKAGECRRNAEKLERVVGALGRIRRVRASLPAGCRSRLLREGPGAPRRPPAPPPGPAGALPEASFLVRGGRLCVLLGSLLREIPLYDLLRLQRVLPEGTLEETWVDVEALLSWLRKAVEEAEGPRERECFSRLVEICERKLAEFREDPGRFGNPEEDAAYR